MSARSDPASRSRGRKLLLTLRKLAERDLALANDRLRLAMESGKSVGWDWDIKSGRDIWFGDLPSMFGIPSDTYSGSVEDFHRRIHPDDRERVAKAVKDAMETHRQYVEEFRILRPDGPVCWVTAKGKFYYSPNGEPERMLGIAVDVTERKLAEETLAGMSRKLLEAQEQERIRIGRELHDDISQRLALVSGEIQQIKEVLPASAGGLRNRMDELEKRTSEISTDIQTLSHELHSSRMEYLGLVSAVKGFCRDFGDKHKVKVDFDSDGVPPRVPQDISICLFRVVQEGLRNALKHSGVLFFEVKLHGSPTEIHLNVRDSGVGFDPELVRVTQGLGLISMQERVRMVNGTIAITSRPQSGTEINVRVHISDVAQTEQTRFAGA
jgi:signal transduction histidine kinase